MRRWNGGGTRSVVRGPGKIVTNLAVVLALGGDCLAEVAMIRAQPELLGPVASAPLGRPVGRRFPHVEGPPSRPGAMVGQRLPPGQAGDRGTARCSRHTTRRVYTMKVLLRSGRTPGRPSMCLPICSAG